MINRSIIALFTVLALAVCATMSASVSPTKPQTRAEPLKCYNCSCTTLPCSCNSFETITDEDTYCVIIVQYYGQRVTTMLGHVDRDSTRVHIRDLPYLLVEESIIFSDSLGVWNTKTNIVLYGCNWDSCNQPDLVQYMPNGFQMRLPEAWLNSSVLGTQQTIQDCHHCPDAPQCDSGPFIDTSRCPVKPCDTTCIVSESFDDPTVDKQCYHSYCASAEDDLTIDPHRVELEGVLYLNKESREVELWEIDIYCRADDCSRPEIFTELREKLNVQLGDQNTLDKFKPTNSAATHAIFNGSILSLILLFANALRF